MTRRRVPQSRKRIEEKVGNLLEQASCNEIPVPLKRIAQFLGVRLEPAMLGDGVSGVLVIGDGVSTIGVNMFDAPVRQRFSIAHELGHFVLHKNSSKLFIDKSFLVFRRDQESASGEKLNEIEANQFAAALLMPEIHVREEIENLNLDLAEESDLDTLAKHFDVSRQAMSIRLVNLGLLI